MKFNTRKIGNHREAQAWAYLKSQHVKILETNYYCRLGEIDGIVKENNSIVFVEVKYRDSESSGASAEAVGRSKQLQISKCAMCYIMENNLSIYDDYRFDVVAIDGNKVNWIKNAFDYCWK